MNNLKHIIFSNISYFHSREIDQYKLSYLVLTQTRFISIIINQNIINHVFDRSLTS